MTHDVISFRGSRSSHRRIALIQIKMSDIGNTTEKEQPKYFVDGRGRWQGKMGRKNFWDDVRKMWYSTFWGKRYNTAKDKILLPRYHLIHCSAVEEKKKSLHKAAFCLLMIVVLLLYNRACSIFSHATNYHLFTNFSYRSIFYVYPCHQN